VTSQTPKPGDVLFQLLGFVLMEVWVSIINAETSDASPIGVYTNKELALATAERVSPGRTDVQSFVIDEIPDWISELEQERRLNAQE
jgi:hypothetical protein